MNNTSEQDKELSKILNCVIKTYENWDSGEHDGYEIPDAIRDIKAHYTRNEDVEIKTKKAFMDGWMQQRANGEEIIVRYN